MLASNGSPNAPTHDFGAGGIQSRAFAVRLGPDGLEKERWSTQVASSNVAAIAADGSVALSGTHDALNLLPGEMIAPPNDKPRTFVITLDPTLSPRWTSIGYTDPVWLAKASPYFLAHSAMGRVAVGGNYGYRLTFGAISMETPNKAPHGWIVALDQ